MTDNTTVDRVTRLVAPLVADLKLDLYDVELRGGTLRVTVDTPPGSSGGVTLDTLALVTRMLSRDLDHDDPMPGHYTLEVTSPGLERQLRTPLHFQRETGKVVAIRLRDTVNGERRIQGVLTAADDSTATIRTGDGDGDVRLVRYDQIDRARTVFEWGPAPKPGKGGKGAKSSAKASARGPARPTDAGTAATETDVADADTDARTDIDADDDVDTDTDTTDTDTETEEI
jgi:ribosome maturation factor RimP